jgi:hypothetical protein
MNTLDNHVIQITDRLKENCRVGDWTRTMLSVALERRYRDMTLSDRYGYFNSRGQWKDLKDQSQLRTFNIVQPTVRATKAVITQANPKIEVQPRLERNYQQQLAVEFARAVKDSDENDTWTASFLERIGDLIQIAPGAFLKTDWCNDSDRTAKAVNYERNDFLKAGEADCPHCDNSQVVNEMILPDEHGFATVPCEGEGCGKEAHVTRFPEMDKVDIPVSETDVPVGKPKVTLHSGLEFLVDETGTSGGNLKEAKWLCHRYLMYEFELREKYPDLIFDNTQNWSYTTRWLYALEKGHSGFSSPDVLLDEFRLHEVEDWYFVGSVFAGRREEYASNCGAVQLKPGENILKKLKTNTGVCFRRVGDRIADVFAKDFRKTFQYISFLKDAHGFWAIPQTVLLTCQDLITEYVTIQSDVASRNIEGTTIVNSKYLNEEDLFQPVVRTRTQHDGQTPFQPAYHVPPAPISPAPMQMVELAFTAKDKLSGVSSIMMGELPGNEPYHSVALQKEQSLGLLSTALHSIALAKTDSDKECLRLRIANMSEAEMLEFVENNDALTFEHLKAFKNSKVDSDFAMDYIPGTAVPRSLFERELAIRQQITDFVAFAQLNPAIITPQAVNDFLGALSELTDSVEIDIGNIKATKQLAQKRYQILRDMAADMPDDIDDEILMEVFENPIISPLSIEEHETAKEFFADRLRQLALQDARDFKLEQLVKMMYAKHEQLSIEKAQFEAQKEMMKMLPVINAQNQMSQQQTAAESQNAVKQKAIEGKIDTAKLAEDEKIKSKYAKKAAAKK